MQQSYDPEVILLGIFFKEVIIYVYTKTCMQMFIAAVHYNEELETTHMSFSRWMVKYTMVCPYHEYYYAKKKELTVDTSAIWMNMRRMLSGEKEANPQSSHIL